ncbi:MAG: tetraacyldisaccharide 4'-kinase [Deltaproteobacteria bacterium]|nr:tetraacyldisaccharide 4'-kinase [Deltaproteobacteria bacterium]
MNLIKYIDGTYNSFLSKVFLFPLYIISLIYGLIIRIRFFFYSAGIFKTRQLPCIVVSIGNITVGGSGKTPMAIYLAGELAKKGKKVVVLSRGYKSKNKDIDIVSDGKNILLNPDEAGDEPFLIAKKTKNIPVVIGMDRYKAGLFAIEKFHPDIIILDDGFQHIRLKRDKDIVLIDSIRGFGNGCLLPRGILREPIDSFKRADNIFVSNDKNEEIIHKIRAAGAAAPVKSFKYKPSGFVNLADDTMIEPDKLKNKNILAFAGIANPISFFKTLEGLGIIIKGKMVFPDHHKYNIKDIEKIKTRANSIDCFITTEKDGVKIKDLLSENIVIYALLIDVEIYKEAEFIEWVCGC